MSAGADAEQHSVEVAVDPVQVGMGVPSAETRNHDLFQLGIRVKEQVQHQKDGRVPVLRATDLEMHRASQSQVHDLQCTQEGGQHHVGPGLDAMKDIE